MAASHNEEEFDPSLEMPEAHDDAPSEGNPYQGKMLGGAAAPVCPGFGPEPLWYLYHDPGMKILSIIIFLGALLAVGSFAAYYAIRTYVQAWWAGFAGLPFLLLSGLLVLAGLALLLLLVVGYRKKALYFENALLTPGVVVSKEPLAIVILGPLGNGSGPEYHGLQRLDLHRLPLHAHEPGTRVPTVSAYYPGVDLDRWVAFNPEPISWGTYKRANIEQCFHRLGTEDFDRLDACIARGLIPKDEDELILLDGNDNKLESLSLKAEKKKHEAAVR